jgi:hypothetical protein
VFRGSPARTRQRIELELGTMDVTCTVVSLEDLFIDLLGGSPRTVEPKQAILPTPARAAGVP